jgi:K+-sensing histidine kinase KdpD
VTEVKRLAKIEEANKLLHLLTSSVTHEMLTPLRCIVSMCTQLLKELKNSPKKSTAELIMNTAKMILS